MRTPMAPRSRSRTGRTTISVRAREDAQLPVSPMRMGREIACRPDFLAHWRGYVAESRLRILLREMPAGSTRAGELVQLPGRAQVRTALRNRPTGHFPWNRNANWVRDIGSENTRLGQ
jgi:hypothetical protein